MIFEGGISYLTKCAVPLFNPNIAEVGFFEECQLSTMDVVAKGREELMSNGCSVNDVALQGSGIYIPHSVKA